MSMTIFYLVIVGVVIAYLICGILAYGLTKNIARHNVYESGFKYDKPMEVLCWLMFLYGPVGLWRARKMAKAGNIKMRLCFFMPPELCETEHEEKHLD